MSLFPIHKAELCLSAGVQEYEGSDAFTRADTPSGLGVATSGQRWVDLQGQSGVSSNRAYMSTAAVGTAGVSVIPCLANGDIEVTLSTVGVNAGIVFRAQDASNCLRFRGNAGVNYRLLRREEDSDTILGTWATAPVNGDVLRVRCEGDQIHCYVNDVLRISVTDTTFSTQTRAGLWAESTTARFDDFSASFVWTDITADVRDPLGGGAAWGWERGRTHEFDRTEAGTCNLTLSNKDRRFEPEYASSPYYPWIIPMRRIRLTGIWTGVEYPRFYGFVERWPLVWNQLATDSTVTVTLVDQFAVLAYRIFADYPSAIAQYNPRASYRMGGNPINDVGPNAYGPLTVRSVTTVVTPGLLPAPAGDDGASTGTWYLPDASVISGTGDFTVVMLCAAAGTTDFNFFTTDLTTAGLRVILSGGSHYVTGRTSAAHVVTGETNIDTLTTLDPVSGFPAFWCAFVRRGLTLEVWLNGVLDGTTTLGAVDDIAPTTWRAGAGTTDEMDWFDSALTPAELLNLANIAGYGPSGYTAALPAGQTTGERVAAICDFAAIGPLERTIDTGVATCAAEDLMLANPRDMLERVRATELGHLYIDGAGKLVFRNRHYTRDQASQDLWSDQSGGYHYSFLQDPSSDVDRIYSTVTATTTDGTAVTVSDRASEIAYQRAPFSFDTINESAWDLAESARWVLAISKDPHLRFDQMQVDGWSQGGIWDHVLSREIGDRITIERQPPGGGATLRRDMVIEKITETVSADPQLWRVAFQLAPEPYETIGWTLDVSALDLDTVLVL